MAIAERISALVAIIAMLGSLACMWSTDRCHAAKQRALVAAHGPGAANAFTPIDKQAPLPARGRDACVR